MQVITTTFLLLAAVLVVVSAHGKWKEDDRPACYTDDCLKKWSGHSNEEKMKAFKECFPDNKFSGANMKKKVDECAVKDYKDELTAYADKCDGKTKEELWKEGGSKNLTCNMWKGLWKESNKTACYKQECWDEWNKRTSAQWKEAKNECMKDGKIDGEALKEKFEKCAEADHKADLMKLAENCNGKDKWAIFKEGKNLKCSLMKGMQFGKRGKKSE